MKREGSYAAIYGWWLKVAVAAGLLVSGSLLQFTGFDDELVKQSESVLFWMRFREIGLPGVLCLAAVFLLKNYGISEERAYEVKKELENRRAAAAMEG